MTSTDNRQIDFAHVKELEKQLGAARARALGNEAELGALRDQVEQQKLELQRLRLELDRSERRRGEAERLCTTLQAFGKTTSEALTRAEQENAQLRGRP